MRWIISVALLTNFLAQPAQACDAPICLVDAETLALTRIVTFDDQPSSFGVGREVNTILVQPGASFGERFLGQTLSYDGPFDQVTGTPFAPLTLIPGSQGQTLGILRMMATTVLHGQGPIGFPDPNATGEGAISVLFEIDQSALSFEIRGGEAGTAQVVFLRRDGSTIHTMDIGPLAEASYGFQRSNAVSDIAGFVLQNTDPDGIAVDNLRFESAPVLGWLR